MGRFQNNNGRCQDLEIIADTDRHPNDKNWDGQSEVFTEDYDSVSVVAPPPPIKTRVSRKEEEIARDDDDIQVMRNCGAKLKYNSRPTDEQRAPNFDKSFEKVYMEKKAEETIQKLIQPNSSFDTSSSNASPSFAPAVLLHKENETVLESVRENIEPAKSSSSDITTSTTGPSLSILSSFTRFPRKLTQQPHQAIDALASTPNVPSLKSEPTKAPSKLIPAGFSLNELDSFGAKTSKISAKQQIINDKPIVTSSSSSDCRRQASDSRTYSISAESSADSSGGGTNTLPSRNNAGQTFAKNNRRNRNNDNNRQQQSQRFNDNDKQQSNVSKFKKAANDEVW